MPFNCSCCVQLAAVRPNAARLRMVVIGNHWEASMLIGRESKPTLDSTVIVLATPEDEHLLVDEYTVFLRGLSL